MDYYKRLELNRALNPRTVLEIEKMRQQERLTIIILGTLFIFGLILILY